MTAEDGERNDDHPENPAQPEQAPTLDALMRSRLADSVLPDTTKSLLLEVLGATGDPTAATSDGRVYLDSVSVTGFRGIGRKTRLSLAPKSGVTLVVGRNGSGKSSLAEGIETAFTGTSARWEGLNTAWRDNWRNLHADEAPKVEVKLGIGGDPRPSTLTRTWPGPGTDISVSDAEFRRPGQARRPFAELDWEQSLNDYRPFLSYSDLDRMISGKPSQMYDTVATILGLGQLTAADSRLQTMEKTLTNAVKEAEAERQDLVEALALLDDPRATAAIAALDAADSSDFAALAALVDGLPSVNDGHLRDLRATVALTGPDLDAVGPAVDRLREALAVLDDVQATGAEDAHQRGELLAKALEHIRRHPDEQACPVCGADRMLDEEWADRAAEQVSALRQEAEVARAAREELRKSADAVRYLIGQAPAWLPPALVDPWQEWTLARGITDPAQLAAQAENAAVVLADACAALRDDALRELEKLDEGWRLSAARLAVWLDSARAARAGKPQLRQVKAARKWLKEASSELRAQRLGPIARGSQRIWEELRQQSNVDLCSVRLTGSDKANVRKLMMDVSVDGEGASALSVMSQGELHALALSLFLPRAAAQDSPFGFVVIDDPVQSMDPAKVHGLAKVLHDLGQSHQVVVFTHDTRLERAFRDQELAVTVMEVERGERSAVKVSAVTDPVEQALDDARALARTTNLPEAAMAHVLPGICRTVLERAFAEAAWLRLHRAGRSEHESDAELAGAPTLVRIAALGLFGDASRAGEVYGELRRVCGPDAVRLVQQCQAGAHTSGTHIPDPLRFVADIGVIAQQVRKPKELQP